MLCIVMEPTVFGNTLSWTQPIINQPGRSHRQRIQSSIETDHFSIVDYQILNSFLLFVGQQRLILSGQSTSYWDLSTGQLLVTTKWTKKTSKMACKKGNCLLRNSSTRACGRQILKRVFDFCLAVVIPILSTRRKGHVAAGAGQASQVELLLVYGADPGAMDTSGKTPMDYAK